MWGNTLIGLQIIQDSVWTFQFRARSRQALIPPPAVVRTTDSGLVDEVVQIGRLRMVTKQQ